MQPTNTLPIRKIFFALGLLIVLWLGYWISGFSFIKVNVTDQQNGDITYSILSHGNNKTVSKSTAATTFKKLVRKGSYEVEIRQGDRSYFAAVQADRFLKTTAVQAPLAPEKARKFVGNNPDPCMIMLGGVLQSYACGGSYSHIITHAPATAALATYSQKNPGLPNATVEGFVDTAGGGTIVILKDTAGAGSHTAYTLTSSLNLGSPTVLSDLIGTSSYSVTPFGDGFLAYNEPLTHVVSYASPQAKPETIDLVRPSDNKLAAYELTARGKTIAVSYAPSNTSAQTDHEDEDAADKGGSIVVVQTGSDTKHVSFPVRVSAATPCADKTLCTVHDNSLQVYDISGNKPRLKYRIVHVQMFQVWGDEVLMLRDKSILGVKTAAGSGTIHYTFGDYQPCANVQVSGSGYLVCAGNNKQKKVALYIDPAGTSDGIDQKVNQLLKLPEVKDISAYGPYISITPEAGKLVVQPEGGYYYDANVIKNANNKINQKISELGIDTETYQVRNVL